ncbi:MAG: beta-galactosidase [Planctomycetes bacterium]|nr:beta-galactosidase [Planctomycetota bacterium]
MNVTPLRSLLLAALVVAVGPAQSRPSRFHRVLWLDGMQVADPALLARVQPAGFTAVNLGAGGDPAPVRAAGLQFYLDQPIGKGLLELRDAQWQPLAAAYETDRDVTALLRPACLRDPGVVAEASRRAVAALTAVGSDGLCFVALADEASSTRHNNPLDVCQCAGCAADFRTFLQGRYRSVDALNAAWGTSHAGWEVVAAPSTDAIRRRELGDALLPANLTPWAERLEFVDGQFAALVARLVADLQVVAPGVPIGLTGLQVPGAFGGHDYARLVPAMTLAEPYDVGGARELAHSLLPAGALRAITIGAPPPDAPPRFLEAVLADAAAHGVGGAVVWNGSAVLSATGVTPFGEAVQRAFARQQPVLDACAGAAIEPSPVWLVESQASVRAWWMLDSARDGKTWVRRLASYEAGHSTSQAARRSWLRLLQDLGLQPRFVGETALPELLLQRPPRCLILPATVALSDRACQAIFTWVRNGGTLLADHDTALYDERLRRRDSGGLDPLFGITARSLRQVDHLVREGNATNSKGSGAALAETGLQARLSERDGDRVVFVEQRHDRGRAVFLNLAVCTYDRQRLDPAAAGAARDLRQRVRQVLGGAGIEPPCDVRGEGLPTCLERVVLRLRDGRRVLAIRVHALDRPGLLGQLAVDGPRRVTVTLPAAGRLRSLAGQELGDGTTFPTTFDVFAGWFAEEVGR